MYVYRNCTRCGTPSLSLQGAASLPCGSGVSHNTVDRVGAALWVSLDMQEPQTQQEPQQKQEPV